MTSSSPLVALILLLCHVSGSHGYTTSRDRIQEEVDAVEADLERLMQAEGGSGRTFVNEWAVRLDGGTPVAEQLALDLGYVNKGQIGALNDYYLLVKSDHPHRSKRSADHHTRSLQEDLRVTWVEQQYEKIRVKRGIVSDPIAKRQEARAYRSVRYDDSYWNRQWYLGKQRKRRAVTANNDDNEELDRVDVDDPEFTSEWYLQSTFFDRRDTSDHIKMDLRVVPTWYKNITGYGVTVNVLDDGLEINHPEIAPNYNADSSYDFNDNDPDPTPKYNKRNSNRHGTRCAGEIVMVANNEKCGVGVAYNAKVGGVRMLDGVVTDRLESQALTYRLDIVDIITCSWGPNDNGATVEGPGLLASKAFDKGIKEGRQGKGLIYVWASGNGGQENDNCDCDGYTASIYTISISSASQAREVPWYAEPCASTMASTYSSGKIGELKIVTTDLNGGCTSEHTGTSASAPLAAGIFALLLESNPGLTWRDVQHLVVWTSEYSPLMDNCGWKENAAGLRISNHFGFGLLNAYGLVLAADPKTFRTVPEQHICEVNSTAQEITGFPVDISSGQEVLLKISTTGCKDQENEIRYLEHVQIRLDMTFSRRGDLEISITSPKGTTINLLSRRPKDHSQHGFSDWPFMSVLTWGEDPQGEWVLSIKDTSHRGNTGRIQEVVLVLYGTKEMPYHLQQAGGRRQYDTEFKVVPDTDDSVDFETMPLDSEDNDDPLGPTLNKESTSTKPLQNSSQPLREKFAQSLDELRHYINIQDTQESSEPLVLENPKTDSGSFDPYKTDEVVQPQPDQELTQPLEDINTLLYDPDFDSSHLNLDLDPDSYNDYYYPDDPGYYSDLDSWRIQNVPSHNRR